jgi:hypothetical protein
VNPPIEIRIVVSPDGYRRVAELWAAGDKLGEIDDESGELAVELYPPKSGGRWRLDLDELLNALAQAGRHVGS